MQKQGGQGPHSPLSGIDWRLVRCREGSGEGGRWGSSCDRPLPFKSELRIFPPRPLSAHEYWMPFSAIFTQAPAALPLACRSCCLWRVASLGAAAVRSTASWPLAVITGLAGLPSGDLARLANGHSRLLCSAGTPKLRCWILLLDSQPPIACSCSHTLLNLSQ